MLYLDQVSDTTVLKSCPETESSVAFPSNINKFEGRAEKCTNPVVTVCHDVNGPGTWRTQQKFVDMEGEVSRLKIIENREVKIMRKIIHLCDIYLMAIWSYTITSPGKFLLTSFNTYLELPRCFSYIAHSFKFLIKKVLSKVIKGINQET